LSPEHLCSPHAKPTNEPGRAFEGEPQDVVGGRKPPLLAGGCAPLAGIVS
jgi:hypothetical protein